MLYEAPNVPGLPGRGMGILGFDFILSKLRFHSLGERKCLEMLYSKLHRNN